MNVIKTIVLIAVLTLGFTSVKAQSKIAHINTEELVALMPETKVLQAKLEKLGKTYDNEMKAKEAELKAKFEKYNAEFASQTEATNAERTKEVQLEAQKIEQFKAEAMRDLQTQEKQGLQPILEKAQKAIDDVAAAQGYDYVFNVAMLVVKKGKDLLPDVKTKLGIQ
jgi:outer membrane protein